MCPLCLLSSPGTWTGQRVPITVLGTPKEAPERPSDPPLHYPPTGAGSTLSWGSRGTILVLMSERPAVPPVPTRGLLMAASVGSRQMPRCCRDANKLGTNLPLSWVIPAHSDSSRGLHGQRALSTPTHGLCSAAPPTPGAKRQKHTPGEFHKHFPFLI